MCTAAFAEIGRAGGDGDRCTRTALLVSGQRARGAAGTARQSRPRGSGGAGWSRGNRHTGVYTGVCLLPGRWLRSGQQSDGSRRRHATWHDVTAAARMGVPLSVGLSVVLAAQKGRAGRTDFFGAGRVLCWRRVAYGPTPQGPVPTDRMGVAARDARWRQGGGGLAHQVEAGAGWRRVGAAGASDGGGGGGGGGGPVCHRRLAQHWPPPGPLP